MAKQLQIRGGTTAEHAGFTGAVRELTVDTDKNTLVVHDGTTAGGIPMATDAEATLSVSGTAPTNPVSGKKWLDTTTNRQYVRYDDQWVETGSRSILPTSAKAYGVIWNQTTDSYTRTGASNYVEIQSKMRRCVVGSNGEVKYYLHPTNSKLKADGTPSVLDGTDGNVMVEIPKTYYKYEYSTDGDTTHSWNISSREIEGYEPHPAFVKAGKEVDYRYYPAYLGSLVDGKLMSVSGAYPQVNKTRQQFRDYARANGEGWHQIDWHLYELVALLAIIEFNTMNIQDALGQGRTALSGGAWSNGSYIGINGLSDRLGNESGNYTYSGDADDVNADLSFMSYRGCENLFGNVWRMIDGINIRDRKVYLNDNPNTYADDVFDGDYKDVEVTMSSSNGYARQIAGNKNGFFPTSVSGGSSAVGTTDYYYQNSGDRIALLGGYASTGLSAGPLSLSVNSGSGFSSVHVGAGVAV